MIKKAKPSNLLISQVEDLIDKEKAAYKHKDLTPRFSPSSAGASCLRKLMYQYTKTEQDHDVNVNVKKAGLFGDMFHDKFASYLRQLGVLIDYHEPDGTTSTKYGELQQEFPVKESDLNIDGKIDLILNLSSDLWVGEMKSCTQSAFDSIKKAKTLMPKKEHYAQGLLYLYLFEQGLLSGQYAHIKALEGFTEVKGILFIYINKNSYEFLEIPILKNDYEFIKLIKKLQTVKDYYQAKTLPPMTSDNCHWCAWRDKCMANKLPTFIV